MFTATLFTMATTWKPPKCPLLDEWMKKYMYSEISSPKKNEILSFVTTWVDLEGI